MKRKITFFTILLGIILLAEILIGTVSKYLILHVPDIGVNQTNTVQALFVRKSDILILGSSRANHSFDCKVIEDSTNLSVYNAGRDGQNIVYDAMVFYSYLQRCTPKLVILDINSSMLNTDWNLSLNDMNCYYGMSPAMDKIVDERSTWVKHLQLLSSIYRYNKTWEWLLKGYTSQSEAHLNGYRPMPVNMGDNLLKAYTVNRSFVPDSTNVSYLNRIVATCQNKGIKLVITYTPSLAVAKAGVPQWIETYCKKHQLPFYNWNGVRQYIEHAELFYDGTHLNKNGATLFTKEFVSLLKKDRTLLLQP